MHFVWRSVSHRVRRVVRHCVVVQVNGCYIPVQVNGSCIPAQINGCCIPLQVNGCCVPVQLNGCRIPAEVIWLDVATTTQRSFHVNLDPTRDAHHVKLACSANAHP